ncbi:hypothetical protein AAFF_G00238140 [Aldrovandia affinis]|uniref:Uncharacterized protein n=1 Tax=Aldrovandia affinis TaxID=143900 RepID=A0AAD7RE93_9TELE|nr:hypothetical protein AAFF_G00238140 [Aldrovandia affinis]
MHRSLPPNRQPKENTEARSRKHSRTSNPHPHLQINKGRRLQDCGALSDRRGPLWTDGHIGREDANRWGPGALPLAVIHLAGGQRERREEGRGMVTEEESLPIQSSAVRSSGPQDVSGVCARAHPVPHRTRGHIDSASTSVTLFHRAGGTETQVGSLIGSEQALQNLSAPPIAGPRASRQANEREAR